MTVKESFALLGLKTNADITAVKQAYRRLAFDLHPDLHPTKADASKQFQNLNEAYVIITQHLEVSKHSGKNKGSASATEKARQEAEKAYSKAKSEENPSSRTIPKEEVLNDILNDPFARRVFEDIYRHVQQKEKKNTSSKSSNASSEAIPNFNASSKKTHRSAASSFSPQNKANPNSSGVVSKIKGWFRRQIDDEQELRLPKASLRAGAVVRLEIQHGIVGKQHSIEIVLPEGYKPGKSIRLKGLGKRVGNISGDLYVRIIPV